VSKPVKLPALQAALSRTSAPADREATPAPSTAPALSEDEVLDPAVFAGLRSLQEPGEPDGVAELAALFLTDTPPRVRAIHEALDAKDASGLREAAHTLKGTASNLGARRLASVCLQIESAARQGDTQVGSVLLPQLDDEYARVCFLLERETKNQNSGSSETE
jgi:HPt (histidine-containing phosphotransfer) domain-containing protein